MPFPEEVEEALLGPDVESEEGASKVRDLMLRICVVERVI